MFFKFDFIRYSFLFIYLISLSLLLFNIFSPNEVLAMAPPHNIVEDFYGHKEFVGNDPYGHFHNPPTPNAPISQDAITPNTRYNQSGNPDYFVSDRRVESRLIHELDGNPVYKSIYRSYDKDELHLWTPGQSLTGSTPVKYHLEPKGVVFELDSDTYEGTISTSVDSVTWARRTHNYMEIIRDYSMYVDNMPNNKNGLLTKISLCVKTTSDNIMFLYLKCNEIGRRKVIWTIWERNRDKYNSYKEFKRNWDNRTDIWSHIEKDIRDDIRIEVEDLLGIKKIKRTLKKSVRAEVEKLLRDTRPFGK